MQTLQKTLTDHQNARVREREDASKELADERKAVSVAKQRVEELTQELEGKANENEDVVNSLASVKAQRNVL